MHLKTKIAATFLLCMGLILISYPKLSEFYYDNRQQDLIQEWRESFQAIDIEFEPNVPNPEPEPASANAELTQAAGPRPEGHEAGQVARADQEKTAFHTPLLENMEGMLYIDAIDLELPILKGVTKENLKTAAASIQGTGELGEIGNYAIAGHRNRTYGRNFNRLDELEAGDRVRIDNGYEQFVYIVTEKLYVSPEDVWVLKGNGVGREITLVTCHPIGESTHRLIVKGKILEEESLPS